jgi:hypothetical protein
MNDALEHLASQLEEERKAILESLGDGAPKSYDEYRYTTGIVRGILMAQRSILNLANQMENSDE